MLASPRLRLPPVTSPALSNGAPPARDVVADLGRAKWIHPDRLAVCYEQSPEGADFLAVVATDRGAVWAFSMRPDLALELADQLADACEGIVRLREEHGRRLRG